MVPEVGQEGASSSFERSPAQQANHLHSLKELLSRRPQLIVLLARAPHTGLHCTGPADRFSRSSDGGVSVWLL